MRLLRLFGPEALHHAVRLVTSEAPHRGLAGRHRLCGRCAALALLQGQEIAFELDLEQQIECGELSAWLFLNTHLQLYRRSGRLQQWSTLDLAMVEQSLIEFIGWVALTEPRVVLERFEREALAQTVGR